jgi:predicted RNase H-like HicB family nuclease
MQEFRGLTGLVQREGSGYVSLCPELDIASQGETVEEARRNLIEAVELFLETADQTEITLRLHKEVYITPLEVSFG